MAEEADQELVLADTAASGITNPTDQHRVFRVLKTLLPLLGAQEHYVFGYDTYYKVEFKDFAGMTLKLDSSVARLWQTLSYVYDLQFVWSDAGPMASVLPRSENLPCILRLHVFVAKAGTNHASADCTDELMSKFKDKVAVEDFLRGFIDTRDAQAPARWKEVQEHIYNIVQMAYRRKDHLPWSCFDFSHYPTRQMYGFHIKNMDETNYAFLRALSTVAGVYQVLLDTRTNEIEVRLNGQDPVPWRPLPGSNPGFDSIAGCDAMSHAPEGRLNLKRSALQNEDYETNLPTTATTNGHDLRQQKRSRGYY